MTAKLLCSRHVADVVRHCSRPMRGRGPAVHFPILPVCHPLCMPARAMLHSNLFTRFCFQMQELYLVVPCTKANHLGQLNWLTEPTPASPAAWLPVIAIRASFRNLPFRTLLQELGTTWLYNEDLVIPVSYGKVCLSPADCPCGENLEHCHLRVVEPASCSRSPWSLILSFVMGSPT